MTEGKKYAIYSALMVGLGTFIAFPYFMQPSPTRLHEVPWQVGLLQAVCFVLAGYCGAKLDAIVRKR